MKALPTEQLIALLGFVLILLLTLAWITAGAYIVNIYTFITYHTYDLFPNYEWIENIKAMLKSANRNANNVSLMNFFYIINHSGWHYAILFSLFSIFIFFKVKKSVHYRFNRQLNVNQLAHIIVKKSPSIAHVLARYANFSDQLLNHSDEESKSPLTPIEFANLHNLIDKEKKSFRKSEARKIFRQQINFNSMKEGQLQLKDYEKALAAIFLLARFFNDYVNAKQLLNQLNLSCLETEDAFPNFLPVIEQCEIVLNTKEYQSFSSNYRSSRTMLYALLDADLSIPPAQFRWLKGLDRTLWMALTSVGRGKKFVEGAGVIAYSITETWLSDNPKYKNLDISPTVRPATNGLEDDLIREGAVKRYKPYLAKGQFLYVNDIESIRLQQQLEEDKEVKKDKNLKDDIQPNKKTQSSSEKPEIEIPPFF
ncbi:conjugal transfer protein TrbA [Xenorhabdus sp. KJ12.1]|uniref:secretion/conjugation apparatus DotM-related subunit n=1 Tax=Xenorhabdus sp. KJ12.1 TaxID=1851571 RepID=UPI000C04F08B|nr:conjugal transfer protein TrbA [Xenorhabdus sp. KJ12.1]PHM67981.1 Dot/Icm type IV secretion system protein IcmP/DotM [Xenorhabdus sp. KJ12.1]